MCALTYVVLAIWLGNRSVLHMDEVQVHNLVSFDDLRSPPLFFGMCSHNTSFSPSVKLSGQGQRPGTEDIDSNW